MVSKLAVQRVAAALAIAAFSFLSPRAQADDKWQGQIPKVADNPDDWTKLTEELMNRGMYYGARISAQDILGFFSDLNSKELAFKTLVKLVDLGYPYSTRSDYVAGDIDPTGNDDFAQSYFLYKGIVNVDKQTPKWADYYFNRIDKENFPKYLFFRANQAYSGGQTTEAIQLLKKALAQTSGEDSVSLSKKESRTLARIYYETGQFDKSLEIYQTYLLRLDPIAPSDWLETAWNLYQLKRFPEALGMLYNLESKASEGTVLLEKYVLRALIYREFCSVSATDQLIKSFKSEFSKMIDGIKLGEPLSSFPQMSQLENAESAQYRQYVSVLAKLEAEAKTIDQLPKALRPLAKYVYSSDITRLKRSRQLYEDRALEALARQLVILDESLKFLKFDVARERFNPDRVFAVAPEQSNVLIDSSDEKNFRIHWLQWGDYWRDERMLYRGTLVNRCGL
jgi:tetratricopeptide (TPR) repeat protein